MLMDSVVKKPHCYRLLPMITVADMLFFLPWLFLGFAGVKFTQGAEYAGNKN